jgi:hypothetical protein
VVNVVLDRPTLRVASPPAALTARAATPWPAGGDISALIWMASAAAACSEQGMIVNIEAGWALKDGSVKPGPSLVCNTTVFDFQGKALPVLGICERYTQ